MDANGHIYAAEHVPQEDADRLRDAKEAATAEEMKQILKQQQAAYDRLLKNVE